MWTDRKRRLFLRVIIIVAVASLLTQVAAALYNAPGWGGVIMVVVILLIWSGFVLGARYSWRRARAAVQRSSCDTTTAKGR